MGPELLSLIEGLSLTSKYLGKDPTASSCREIEKKDMVVKLLDTGADQNMMKKVRTIQLSLMRNIT